MTQNIYDDPTFRAKFLELKNSSTAKVGVPDIDKLHELLPPLHGADILDLGCGDGWFARWARSHGATTVRGVDVSIAMLDEARKLTNDENITFATVDLNDPHPALRTLSYNLVFSSLVVHWIRDLSVLLREVHGCLKPGGIFYFSIEHPMRTAPHSAKALKHQNGKMFWPMSDYSDEGDRIVSWLAEGVVKQHRTMESYITGPLEAGFEIVKFQEWGWPKEGGYTKTDWHFPIEVMPAFCMFMVRKKI